MTECQLRREDLEAADRSSLQHCIWLLYELVSPPLQPHFIKPFAFNALGNATRAWQLLEFGNNDDFVAFAPMITFIYAFPTMIAGGLSATKFVPIFLCILERVVSFAEPPSGPLLKLLQLLFPPNVLHDRGLIVVKAKKATKEAAAQPVLAAAVGPDNALAVANPAAPLKAGVPPAETPFLGRFSYEGTGKGLLELAQKPEDLLLSFARGYLKSLVPRYFALLLPPYHTHL